MKIDQLKILGDRLKKINLDIECLGNFPWVYLHKVNNIVVKEKLDGNHGFTIAWIKKEGIILNNEYKKIFNILRKYYYLSKFTELELINIAESHLNDKKANMAMEVLKEKYGPLLQNSTYEKTLFSYLEKIGHLEQAKEFLLETNLPNCCLNKDFNEQTNMGL